MPERRRLPAKVARPGQIALALAVALLGFLLATQFRARESLQGRLATQREEDLAQLLGNLQQQSDQLGSEIATLQVQLARAAGAQDKEAVLVENAAARLDDLRMMLGLVPAKGPGISITVADPERTIGADILIDAVQELRDAGAEAIEINKIRVVAQTAFAGAPGRLTVDQTTTIHAPYVVRAIGDGDTLAQAMKIPGGVVDSVSSRPGASIDVTKQDKIVVASLHPAPRFSYATRA